MRIMVFWAMTPCSWVDCHQCFRGTNLPKYIIPLPRRLYLNTYCWWEPWVSQWYRFLVAFRRGSVNHTNRTRQITSKLLLHTGKDLFRKEKHSYFLPVICNTTINTNLTQELLKQWSKIIIINVLQTQQSGSSSEFVMQHFRWQPCF
jgi:hypothetical protein